MLMEVDRWRKCEGVENVVADLKVGWWVPKTAGQG